MVAAVAKLMSNLDLVMAGKKLRVVVRCNATLGLPGRISSRLQPNHPTDDVAGVIAAIKDGLSYGNGDAVIGVNPATGELQGTIDILTAVKDLMRRWRVPTQNCVLSHITIQMAAVPSWRAARPDVPEYCRQRGRQPQLRRHRGHARRGP
jgi:ethanolamine ammonia-lyase large subunit